VNLKAFFVATLGSALDLGIAVPDDVIRHVTADVLSIHLPRPLWARLLTACVGAPRVDAQLVVETIGVANLCEHVPAPIIWACIAELGARSLGGGVPLPVAAPPRADAAVAATASRPVPLATPPPPPAAEPKAPEPRPASVGPSIPAPGSEPDEPGRRAPPGQRFRPSNSGIGRLATNSGARRPQAAASPPTPPPQPAVAADAPPARVKRGQTESDYDLETFVGGKDDWKNALAVEDEQLVDWSASDETQTTNDDRTKR
jgi:hypothetical protein